MIAPASRQGVRILSPHLSLGRCCAQSKEQRKQRMKIPPWLSWLVLAPAVLLLSGCLELTGQRLTLRYDAGLDRLYLLIQYDGIHNNKETD